MAKNQKNSSVSEGICEKLYKAVASMCYSCTPYEDQVTRPTARHNRTDELIPINFDFSLPNQNGNANTQKNGRDLTGRNRPGAEMSYPARNSQGPRHGAKEEIARSGSDINNRFTAYINHFRNKIAATSNVDGERDRELEVEEGEEKETRSNLDDRVSEYITRKGMKIRTTSSNLGFGKTISFQSKGK